MDKLDKEAKTFYLTKDAFEQPKAMKFDRAMEVYKPENIINSFEQPDRDAISKACVEAHFTHPSSPESQPETLPHENYLEGSDHEAAGGPLSDSLLALNELVKKFEANHIEEIHGSANYLRKLRRRPSHLRHQRSHEQYKIKLLKHTTPCLKKKKKKSNPDVDGPQDAKANEHHQNGKQDIEVSAKRKEKLSVEHQDLITKIFI
ncbi:hypothetical protein KEM48_008899 [Puccinia striiformis f. sp. tritici PST-130]|nr:hypothetical protein KEM48_008899 [Puccinia striiformis f. sp. tritici PST-130]